MPSPPPPPLSFRRSAPSSVTHHPLPLPSSPLPSSPLPFRSHNPSPSSSPARQLPVPVPVRPRPSSYSTTQRFVDNTPSSSSLRLPSSAGAAGPAGVTTALTVSPQSRSRSHNELRHRGPRVVSFGSAVTPGSAGSTTSADDPVSGSEGPASGGARSSARSSWEWPWDDDEAKLRARRAPREDSSGSGSDFGDRPEARARRLYGRPNAMPLPARSQSALAGEAGASAAGLGTGMGTPRADGPRPWDMTELSGKNFASFGWRKGGWDGFEVSSRHLGRKGKGRSEREDGKWEEGRKRFRLFGRRRNLVRGKGFLRS